MEEIEIEDEDIIQVIDAPPTDFMYPRVVYIESQSVEMEGSPTPLQTGDLLWLEEEE